MANGWHRRRDTAATKQRARQYASKEHRDKVRECKRLVAEGRAVCWRCHRPIPPGTPVHAGHDDHDRTIYRGPEHPTCNLKAAARKGARMRNTRATKTRAVIVRRRNLLG